MIRSVLKASFLGFFLVQMVSCKAINEAATSDPAKPRKRTDERKLADSLYSTSNLIGSGISNHVIRPVKKPCIEPITKESCSE